MVIGVNLAHGWVQNNSRSSYSAGRVQSPVWRRWCHLNEQFIGCTGIHYTTCIVGSIVFRYLGKVLRRYLEHGSQGRAISQATGQMGKDPWGTGPTPKT